MLQSAYYKIGEHLIEIVTGNAPATKALLPAFSAFEVQPGKGQNLNNPLFRFSGGNKIEIPGTTAVDELRAEGIHTKIYTTEAHIYAGVEINGNTRKLKASRDWKIVETDLTLTDPAELGFIKHFLVTAYGMASSVLKTVKLHASVIEKDGKALVFLGKSGTGKSTHSRLWLQYVPGSSLLNDDEPIVRLQHGEVIVYGAPWSGSTACYRNISANVAGFVHLHQSPDNKLTQLNGIDALSSVLKHCSVFRSNVQNKETIFNTITDILSLVPVYRLDCRADREAVSLTEALM